METRNELELAELQDAIAKREAMEKGPWHP